MTSKNTEIIAGIVIKTERTKDADLRIRLLCADGLRNLTATGVLKPNAKLNHAVQLFTIAEYTIAGAKIIGANVLHTNHEIAKNIKNYYLACAICEVILQIPHQDDHGVFALVALALAKLCSPADTRAIYTDFFTALLIELGYDIDESQDINTAYAHHLDIKIPNTNAFL